MESFLLQAQNANLPQFNASVIIAMIGVGMTVVTVLVGWLVKLGVAIATRDREFALLKNEIEHARQQLEQKTEALRRDVQHDLDSLKRHQAQHRAEIDEIEKSERRNNQDVIGRLMRIELMLEGAGFSAKKNNAEG